MSAPESCELAAFDAPLARAVVAVLRAAGMPATLREGEAGEAAVLVPANRRAEAMDLLAARMDDIRAEAALSAGTAPAGPGWTGDEASDRPLVLERFRRLGWVAAALVPLLAVTLASVRLPPGAVVLAVVGAVVVMAAWKSGRLGGMG